MRLHPPLHEYLCAPQRRSNLCFFIRACALIVFGAGLCACDSGGLGFPFDGHRINRQPQAIVGGQITDAFAATGALQLATSAGQSLCTASLVAPDMLLTAAHCVDDIEPAQTEFRLGMDLTQPSLVRRLEAVASHPNYAITNDGAVYDVAVAWLERPITEVAPVQVTFQNAEDLIGQRAVLVGYGATGIQNQSSVGSGVRRGAQVVIDGLEMTHIRSQYERTQSVVCRGDSGGPAFAMVGGVMQQVGITSLGDTQCMVLGLYSRLDLAEDWLRQQGIRETAGMTECGSDRVCNGACEADADCEVYLCPKGTCVPADDGCTPVAVTYVDARCEYLDGEGRVCGSTDLVEVEYDEGAGVCRYIDPLGVSCVQTEPQCSSSGDCSCPS